MSPSAERPDSWNADDLSLPLTYRFEPGAADDGVTVHVPVEVLARLVARSSAGRSQRCAKNW